MLNKQTTISLKGLFAVLILIHHLYQYSGIITNEYIGMLLQSLGYLSVSVFLFLSGYGLMSSFLTKDNYLSDFPKRRLLPFFLEILFLTVAYCILSLVISPSDITIEIVIKSFSFGGTIIRHGWYLQIALLLYLAFFLIFKFVKKNAIKIVVSFVFCFSLAVTLFLLNYSSTWYECIFVFPMGLLFAFKKESLETFIKNNKFICFLIPILLFAATIFGYIFFDNTIVKLVFKIISTIPFVASIVVFSMFVSLNNKITQILGKYSFSLYVSQGFFLWILRIDTVRSSGYLWLFLIVVFVCIAIVTFAINQVFYLIEKPFKSLN